MKYKALLKLIMAHVVVADRILGTNYTQHMGIVVNDKGCREYRALSADLKSCVNVNTGLVRVDETYAAEHTIYRCLEVAHKVNMFSTPKEIARYEHFLTFPFVWNKECADKLQRHLS